MNELEQRGRCFKIIDGLKSSLKETTLLLNSTERPKFQKELTELENNLKFHIDNLNLYLEHFDPTKDELKNIPTKCKKCGLIKENDDHCPHCLEEERQDYRWFSSKSEEVNG